MVSEVESFFSDHAEPERLMKIATLKAMLLVNI